MKKKAVAMIAAGAMIASMVPAVSAYSDETEVSVSEAPDYSKEECWFQIPEITKDVDTFYIYATEYIAGSFEEGAPDYATLDNAEMLQGVSGEYVLHATTFEDSTNLFLPYYRQAGLRYAGEIHKKTGDVDAALLGIPYDDITAALDYYFENYNDGRPFIIAGHSQGSAMTLLLLRTYFKDHPEYYKRMVAAYPIGYSVTDEYLAANPHLKFATGETDTGVIVSWNTEGPKNVETNAHNVVVLPNTRSINPLNWKLDETYAPASENLGSLIANEETGEVEIGDLGADAQINLARGVVVTNAKTAPMDDESAKVAAEFFGPDGHHGEDYTFFYNNIKDNVAKRVEAYMANADENTDEAPDYSEAECWYKIPEEITKDVDTFYIYSTMYFGANEGDPDCAPLDNAEVLENIDVEHAIKSSVFEDSTNLFIPFYRQAGMSFALREMEKTGSIDSALSGIPYQDITAALDYYFENCNEGRPFVIAGHSQGAAILRLVLQGYFKDHPEYYERMVAAYPIGYSVTEEYLAANPHLKFATGESDTGVIISWNTEGPKNVEENATNALVLPNAISINPLNWKLDETYAPSSENLGSIVIDEKTGTTEIRDIGGDAQVNLARGTVITNADAVPNDMAEYTGPQSYHQDDYSIFYNNIKDNVAKRIAAYQAK